MRLLFGLVLIVGVGLAGFAVYMAQGFIGQMTAERNALLAAQASAKPTVPVFVVNVEKAYGETLLEEELVQILWQEDSLPEGIFRTKEEIFPEGKDPRIVLSAMTKFEPLLSNKVTAPGEDAGITSRLGKGMRAFAIRTDVSSGVSGFLRPGDRVDVYWTGQVDGNEFTKLIEAGVRLIAVDQTSDTGRQSPVVARTVTVAATPNQVASLAQAQSTGRLSLSLVGAEDDSVAEVVQVDQNALLGIEKKVVKEAVAAKEKCYAMQNKGGERIQTDIEIACPIN